MTFDWYKRDVKAAIKGMVKLTLEERGAYNSLIDHQYLMDGDLRDDDFYIAGLLGCHVRVWKRIKQVLIDQEKISTNGDYIGCIRARLTVQSRSALRDKRVSSGRAGGISSGKARKNNGLDEALASSALNQRRLEEKRKKKNPSGSKKNVPKIAKRIPPDFKPKPETVASLKEELGINESHMQAELLKFHDYWIAASGANASKLDWEATYRNWIRKSMENYGRGNGSAHPSRPQQGDIRSDGKIYEPFVGWIPVI